LDAAWAVGALLLLIAVVTLTGVTSQTLVGIGEDLTSLGAAIPAFIGGPVSAIVSLFSLLAAPGVFTYLLVAGRTRVAGLTLASGALGAGLAALTAWIIRIQPDTELQRAFTAPPGGLPDAWPFLAFLVATLAVPSFSERSRVAILVRWSVALLVAVSLLDGRTTVPSVAVALLAAAAAVTGVRFLSGVTALPIGAQAIAATLAPAGLGGPEVVEDPGALERMAVTEGQSGFRVGAARDVIVLTRDRLGTGLARRLWRRIRVSGEIQPPLRFSLRRSVDREVLLAQAAWAAGVRTPTLHGALPVQVTDLIRQQDVITDTGEGPDAVALVFDHVPTRALSSVDPVLVSDQVLADLWQQVAALHRRAIAHRRLSGRSLRLDDVGRVWIVGLGGGDVAADPVAMHLDVAEALLAVAAVAGVDRAVSSALSVLGPQEVGAAAGLLQPVLLGVETRALLRRRRDLLPALRGRVGTSVEVVSAPPRLERLRPTTILTWVGVLVALYLVAGQLTGVNLARLAGQADPVWIGISVLASAATYVGAAYAVIGFVPERLSVWRTTAVQVALDFVRLLAPTAVGAVAINVRYLTRLGVPGPAATASLAASQLMSFVVSVALLPVLGALTGRNVTPNAPGIGVVAGVLAGAAVVIGVVTLWPTARARVLGWGRRFVATALPRLAEVAQRPVKLAQGVGGSLLITLSYVAALYASVRAFGGDVPIALVAVVYVTGNAVGSAVPTPGGLGAVEAVLTGGLTAIGVPAAVAVPAVLLFRLVTFWLPLLPGWASWTLLRRREIV
jgi:uncharacterized membrane protein YbhN (UPF0104 family)